MTKLIYYAGINGQMALWSAIISEPVSEYKQKIEMEHNLNGRLYGFNHPVKWLLVNEDYLDFDI